MSGRYTERRVVTALFVDVVGSAALTVELGPERLKRALDRAFADLSGRIAAEGGTVEKYVGDAIHALFGAPVGHPDDSQRALRAAQACLDWADQQAGRVVAFAVRIGVETGEAIVDLSAVAGERQQMSVGTCVNVAARLQQLAEPGQALVGPTCREAAGDVAEFRDLGDVELKGLGPVRGWRLLGVHPPRPAGRVPFVGRRAELDLLHVAFRRAASGRSVFALVSGPPGQGKTRLVEEFLGGVRAEARVLEARCRPGGETGARNPLCDLLLVGGIDPSSEALAAALADTLPAPAERRRVVAALLHSAGVEPSPELAGLGRIERLDEITDAWRRYLGALARARSLVVWVEDLHWAEAELVLLLDRLASGASAPVLTVATARPEFAEQAALRPSGDRFFVELDDLDPDGARTLARHAAGRDPAHLGRAGGNPLFIIELARSRGLASGPGVPLSLQAVIGARLDELPLAERELLQRAAVIGETFDARGAGLLSGRDAVEVARQLARLLDLQYLQVVPGGYRFHHAVVRDVAGGRLPTAERMRLHAVYARAGIGADDPEALAHHLWQAVGLPDAEWVWEGSEELSSLRADAFRALLAAGRRYAERFAYERAIEAHRRARGLALGPAEGARVERALADAQAAQGEADEAWTHYRRARELYREAGEEMPADAYCTLLDLAVYNFGMFRDLPAPEVIDALIHEGEAVATRTGDAASLARLLAVRSHRAEDLAVLEAALRLFERAVDRLPFAPFLQQTAVRQVRLGELAAAAETFARLDALVAAGGRIDPSWRLEHRGMLALGIGDLDEAERVVDDLVSVSATRGPHLQTHASREKLNLLLSRGDWGAVRQLAAEVERLVERHPATPFCYAVTTAFAFAAVAATVDGRGEEARALVSRAEAPRQAPPFDREAVLLLAYAVVGRAADVERLRLAAREARATPPWWYRRTEAVALTMGQRWEELVNVLVELDATAAKGSRYLPALAAAIREEMATARGGPVPVHAALRALGYLGWSALLRHRPPPG